MWKLSALALALALGPLAGCRSAPEGFGNERSRHLAVYGGLGFAMDERYFDPDLLNTPALLGIGAGADYYFVDEFSLGPKFKTALDVKKNEQTTSFYELTLNAKLQGDLSSLKPYLHAGVGWMLAETQRGEGDTSLRNKWAFEWGAGTDVYFTDEWALFIDASMNHTTHVVFGEDDRYLFETLFGVKYKF